jgi:hypothetical protein
MSNILRLERWPALCLASLLTRFGQEEAVQRLLKICKVDLTSEKLQKAAWYGNLFKAARSGDAKLMEEVLDHDHARTRILALRQPKV